MDWLPFTTTNINVNLGATDGVYNVNVGLRGDPTGAVQTWNHYTFRLDRVAPVLTITNPVLVHAAATVTKPYLQLQGYADKPLASLSYDLNNAALSVTQQDAFVTDQVFDTNQFDFTTNFFQAFDVPLTNGLNSLTLRATDRAGNTTTTQFTVTLDYTTATAPPVVNVIWPQDQMAVSGTSLTIRGTMSDETGTILAQVTDANHNVTPVPGLVERNNMFWIENVPLNATGSTPITIQATDAAGNVTSVPLTVLPSSHTLTIDSTPTGTDLYQPSGSVTGSVGDASATVTVNGMPATITTENSDGTYEWEADNVPIYGIGTATFDAVAISASTSSASSGGGNSEMQPADRAQPMDTSPPGDNVSAEVEMPAAWIFASYNCGETHYYDYGTFKGYPSYKCDYFTCAYTGSLAPGAGGRWSSTYAGTYFNYDIFDWGDGDVDPTPTTTTIGWSDQNPFGIKMYVSGGQTTMTQFQDGYPYGISGNSSFYNAYPNGMSWNQMFVPRQDLEGDPEDHPIYMVEYYADDVGYTWNLGGSTHSFSMAARSQVKLYTGGKAPVARSSLFCIGASAVEYPDLPADWQGAPSTPIPNTKLVVLKKSVGSDGNLWVVLPDNSPGVDITVSAPGYKHFNALFGQQKYRLDVTATVNGITDDISANTPTFCVGQEVNLTVQWTPSLPENPKRSSGRWVLGGEYIDSSAL